MGELQTLAADTDPAAILDVLRRDGALILKDMISPQMVARVHSELAPYIAATPTGADDFSGNRTTRTGALVARSPACRTLILNETIDELCQLFLGPNCARHQLHLGQVITIRPGQKPQSIHRDRWAWGSWIKDIEPQLNTIWAISDFTKENGATQVVPGSVDWPDDRQPVQDEIRYAEMSAGSLVLYTGSVFHGGGANTSNAERIGINLTYTLGWLRQEENQYLSCPPDIARTLDPKLQSLIGYTMGSYALGYYTPPLPPGEGPETVGPEFALGQDTGSESRLGSADMLQKLNEALSAK